MCFKKRKKTAYLTLKHTDILKIDMRVLLLLIELVS